jgi:hypothetical protein
VTDAAVGLVLQSFVNPVALLTFLLALGTLVFEVFLEILARDFDKLASVTTDLFHWADIQVFSKLAGTKGRARTFIRAG